ncbi:MAG: hypothetical protein MR601_03840 [Erysipelotrichaceae bacterium]|nr:hypothetical protein [Erysipelotrichaceae bacterium]
MCEISSLEKLITALLIREDAETIYSLLQTEGDAVFAMGIIPYYVLFVQSCQEYMGENFLQESMQKNFKDIRNHIKAYSERFEKSLKRVAFVDDTQNEYFKNQLRFNFLKNINIHFNLGSYWTDTGVIIGNTQQLADFLSVKNMFDPTLEEKSYKMGCQIGSFVAAVREGFSNFLNDLVVERPHKSIKINYYCDINTNNKNKLFLRNTLKELNLFFLHLLCNMNFVKYILRPLLTDGNTWMFRVEYIVSYYTLRALERFKNYCRSNKHKYVETEGLIEIIKEGEKIFKTQLRNCMMHYNLNGSNVIMPEYIDKPFYGIIESCFDGMSYQRYLVELHNLSDKIISYLELQFDFSYVKLKKL